MTVAPNGDLLVFNGTFSPELSIYSAATGTLVESDSRRLDHRQQRLVWRHRGEQHLCRCHRYGNCRWGVAKRHRSRSNLTDGTAQRFSSGNDYIQLTLGLDGNVYALGGLTVFEFDPNTMAQVRTISLSAGADLRAIAVDSNGDIFAADYNHFIFHFDASGTLINSLLAVGKKNRHSHLDRWPGRSSGRFGHRGGDE